MGIRNILPNIYPDILVIGSCHLDVLADFSESTAPYKDKPGTVHIAIGGTVFNIAVNLALNGFSVSILTVLKKSSIFSDVIAFKLREVGVKTSHIIYSDEEKESGFVAHRANGELISSVTSTVIESHDIPKAALRRRIRSFGIVIADCNLSQQQLIEVGNICNELKKRLVIAAVSDAKVKRLQCLQTLSTEPYVELISMNESEAKEYEIDLKRFAEDDVYRIGIINGLRTREFCITLGAKGLMYSAGPTLEIIPPPPIQYLKSTSGAGDAVLSAFVAWKVRYAGSNKQSLKDTVHKYVAAVLSTEGTTVQGITRTEHLLAMVRRKNVIVRVGENAIIFNYLSLVSFIVAILGTTVGAWMLARSTRCVQTIENDAKTIEAELQPTNGHSSPVVKTTASPECKVGVIAESSPNRTLSGFEES